MCEKEENERKFHSVCVQSYSRSDCNRTQQSQIYRWRKQGGQLINIALAIGVWLAVGPLLHVGHVLVKMRQRHRVLLVDMPLHVCLQHRPLIVRKCHGEQRLGVTHKLIDVPLPCHLDGHGQNKKKHFWFGNSWWCIMMDKLTVLHKWRHIYGVPQASILGPLFFYLHMLPLG